eukprot:Sdes_comp20556_c0_seq2m15357
MIAEAAHPICCVQDSAPLQPETCLHKCLDKTRCRHICCKGNVKGRKRAKTRQVVADSTITKEPPIVTCSKKTRQTDALVPRESQFIQSSEICTSPEWDTYYNCEAPKASKVSYRDRIVPNRKNEPPISMVAESPSNYIHPSLPPSNSIFDWDTHPISCSTSYQVPEPMTLKADLASQRQFGSAISSHPSIHGDTLYGHDRSQDYPHSRKKLSTTWMHPFMCQPQTNQGMM